MEQIDSLTIKDLYNLKHNYENNIKIINSKIKEKTQIRINNCNHEWIKEREPGQYGELYTLCKICRVDFHLRDWIHTKI